MPAADAGMVGSPSTALRRSQPSNAAAPSGRRLEPMPHRPLPQLRAVGIDSLGFDPRQKKDALGSLEPQQAVAERGTALAKQQCLAINLVNLLQQVLSTVNSDEEVNPLEPAEDLLTREDPAILSELEGRFARMQATWIRQDRSRRLPGLCQLLSVAHERPLMPRRGLRTVFEDARQERPWLPNYDLGSGGRSLDTLFRCASVTSAAVHALPRLWAPSVRHFEARSLPRIEAAVISIDGARQRLLDGTATEADKRVLREHQEHEDKEAASKSPKRAQGGDGGHSASPRAAVQRRKSSGQGGAGGQFFVWGECVMPMNREQELTADDMLMADLTAGEDDSKEKKKKAHGGRKRRMSVAINDEVEETKIIDDQGVFHFGDFAVQTETTGATDNWTTCSKNETLSGAAAVDNFSFGDFAIGLDEETVKKHDPGKLAKKKPQGQLAVPKKEPKPGGLTIVNYKMHHLIGHAARVKCVAVSPDESTILSCSHEDLIVVLSDVYTGREMVSFSGHDDTLTSVAFSADQKHVATTSRDQNLILWDAITAKVLLQFEHEKVVICCAWSKSGRLIVSGCQDKVCRVWDTKKGKERAAFTEHTAIIISLDFAPDDKHIVSASADKTVRIWTVSGGQSVKVLKGHSGIVLGCRYLPDGKQVLSNDENEIKLWDVKTGACKLSMHVENIQMALPVTRTKKRFTWTLCSGCPGDFGNYIIASCNLRTVIIFERQTGEEVLTFYTRAPVYCLASSLHDKVVLGDSMGNIYVITLLGI